MRCIPKMKRVVGGGEREGNETPCLQVTSVINIVQVTSVINIVHVINIVCGTPRAAPLATLPAPS